MRTYGVHGGERQLSRLFGQPRGDVVETFFHLYRDKACEDLFSRIPGLQLDRLLPFEIPPRPLFVVELAILVVLLPLLQMRLLWLLRRYRCRICVVHGFQGAVVAWLAAMILPWVRFAYVHRGTKSALGKHRLFRLLYLPYKVVAGVSRASAASLHELVPAAKLIAIENGIDWRAVAQRAKECRDNSRPRLILICIGRLMLEKGQRLVVAAFQELLKNHPACELWLVGDGPDRAYLEAQCQHHGMEGSVRFLGWCEDVACLLGQSDIFVHASESEGLSNAVLEAMAVGLPSVVVDAPGVSECHVPGETGIVVRRDAHAMAQALTRLAGDAGLRKRFAQSAQQRVGAHYSVDANRARYDALYRQLGSGE
jgi:glycosyltransferase involved in cell wall biosynthesis